MHPKVKENLDAVLSAFESGKVVDFLEYSRINNNRPCSAWSMTNQLLCFIHGTSDARGIRQWNKEERHVLKGKHAFYILAPRIKKEKFTDEAGNEKEETFMAGFIGVPVFRVEDTDGKPVEYPELKVPMPRLADVADRFGVSVRFLPSNARYWGYYGNSITSEQKEIVLCTTEETVFFHELAHAAHHRVKGYIKGGQDWKQEIVAELCAAVIARMFGKEPTENNYQYIARYAKNAGKSAFSGCIAVLNDTKKVLDEIFATVDAEIAA